MYLETKIIQFSFVWRVILTWNFNRDYFIGDPKIFIYYLKLKHAFKHVILVLQLTVFVNFHIYLCA